jgi:hypothetical protein
VHEEATTRSLVEAILDETDEDSFALVVGPRMLVDLEADGRLKRTQLKTFLKGDVSTLLHGPGGNRKRSQTVTSVPWDEEFELRVDFGVPGTRWRLLDSVLRDSTYLLPHLVPAIRPAVIVDVDAVPLRLPFREYEAGHLGGDTTLVVPHSDAAERYHRDVLEWAERGRPQQENDWAPEMNPFDRGLELEHSRRQVPIHEAAVVLAAVGVTALFEDGGWRDPSALEAARKFIQSHPDLRIGISDLVKTPSLRESLLRESPVSDVPTTAATIPAAPLRRVAEREAAQEESWELEESFQRSLANRFKPLISLGWKVTEQKRAGAVVVVIGSSSSSEGLMLPLTKAFEVEGKETPLAWLALIVNKRSTRVEVSVAVWRQYKTVRPYLEARGAHLLEIAAPGSWEFASPAIPILWGEKGGWGDDVDWSARVEGLAEHANGSPSWQTSGQDWSESWLRHPWSKY